MSRINFFRNPVFRKVTRIATVVFVALFVTLWIAGLIFEGKIKTLLLTEINKQLTVKVEVDEVTLSLFRHFPKASLRFVNVRIPSFPGDPVPMVDAQSLSLQFSILDLLRKNYTIRNVVVQNGRLSLVIPREGRPNYLILKEGSDDQEAISFALQKVRVMDVDVVYRDYKSELSIDFGCIRNTLRGNFSEERYHLRADGQVHIRRVQIADERYFTGQDATLALVLDIDQITGVYTFSKGDLEVEGMPFLVNGTMSVNEGNESLDLEVKGNRLTMSHLFDLLPEQYQSIREDYRPEGNVDFSGTISGGYSGGRSPDLRFGFGFSNASLTHKGTGIAMTGISCTGEVALSTGESYLKITDLTSQLGQGSIQGDLALFNFSKPVVRVDLDAALDIGQLLTFFPVRGVENGEGKMRLQLKAESEIGLSDSLSLTHLLHSRSNGVLELAGVAFRLTDHLSTYSGIDGRFLFDNNDLKIEQFKAIANRSDVALTGYARNVIPWLLMEQQQLEFKGSLRSSQLNLKELIFSVPDGDQTKPQPVILPSGISGSLEVAVGQLQYDAFQASGVKGRIQIAPGRVYAEQVSMDAFNGKIDGKLLLTQLKDSTFAFDCALNTSRADVSILFRQFNNFGQDDLTDKHLRGLLTSRMLVHSKLTPMLSFVAPSVEAVGELVIEQGALIGYEPVKALAKYTRIDDLSNIRFKTLRNEIRISGGKITIPEMMIRSDAVDMALSGTHTFEGKIVYHLKMLLSELLSKKAKRSKDWHENDDSGETDLKGRLTLNLIIDGTVDNPNVRYDRKNSREKAKEEFQTEKGQIRTLFTREFGTFIESNGGSETPAARKGLEGEILIEWEDE
jgi:hypothetical protein